jgi:hypothetical protein
MPPMRVSPVLAEAGTSPFVRLEQAKRRLRAADVALIDFGKGGAGSWRLALVPSEQECRRAAAVLAEVL